MQWNVQMKISETSYFRSFNKMKLAYSKINFISFKLIDSVGYVSYIFSELFE